MELHVYVNGILGGTKAIPLRHFTPEMVTEKFGDNEVEYEIDGFPIALDQFEVIQLKEILLTHPDEEQLSFVFANFIHWPEEGIKPYDQIRFQPEMSFQSIIDEDEIYYKYFLETHDVPSYLKPFLDFEKITELFSYEFEVISFDELGWSFIVMR